MCVCAYVWVWVYVCAFLFCFFNVIIFSTETGQGWGITTDGDSLIVSDGSEFLFFWDLETMEETRRIQVCLSVFLSVSLNVLVFLRYKG